MVRTANRLCFKLEFRSLIDPTHPGLPSSPCLVTLPDPATAAPNQYLVVPATPTAPPSVQELNVFSASPKPSYASWFGPGENVIKDGQLYIFTPMHVNFLILPALLKIQGETPGTFCGLDHVVESMGASDAFGILVGLLTHESQISGIERICDIKENAGDTFVKLNEDKLLEWLKTRVERVRSKIQEEDIAFASCSEEEMRHYGISVVAEYVPAEVEAKLYASFGLEKRKEVKPRQTSGPLDMPRVEHVEDRSSRREELEAKRKQDAKDKAKAQREEDKARKRAKEVAGIPKISSFFTKKKK